MDGESGFHQVPLAEASRDCTTFLCHRGQFRWKVLPFGLKNSSAVFQRIMTQALKPFIGISCMIYIDDIIIATATWEEHVQAISRILAALRKVGFTLKRKKCNFCLPTMCILGLTISADGIHLKGEHSKAVTQFPHPKTKQNIQQFLGLANFFADSLKASLKKLDHWRYSCAKTTPSKKMLKKQKKQKMLFKL